MSEQDFDVALIDLAMPGESGFSLLRFLREQEKESDCSIPLMVVSACALDKDRKQAFDSGASSFIAKPFEPEEIVSSIQELIDNEYESRDKKESVKDELA